MLFGKKEYVFYRKDWIYKLQNIKGTGVISYTLYKIINGSKVEVSMGTLNAGDKITLSFPEENLYELIITPDNSRIDIYSINYINTIKNNMLLNLKDIICKCNSDNNNNNSCSYGNPVSETNQFSTINSINYGIGSVLSYISVLFSPSFIRPLYYPINVVWGDFSVKLISDLLKIDNNINLNGYIPDSNFIAELTTAIEYGILYSIEQDIVSFKIVDDDLTSLQIDVVNGIIGELDTNTEKVDIDTLYNISTIKPCFTDLGIDFDYVVAHFNDVYSYGNIGIINFGYKESDSNNSGSVPGYTIIKSVTINSIITNGKIGNNDSLLPEGYIIDQFVITNTTGNDVTLNIGWSTETDEIVSNTVITGNSTTPIYPYEQTKDGMPASPLYISSANWNSAILDITIIMKKIL